MKRFTYLFFSIIFACSALAKEGKLSADSQKILENREYLVFVQAVSKSGKTFVIRKGLQDGILPGQKSLFSTNNVSIAAVAVEVNGEYSAWKVSGKDATVPFAKKEAVIYASNPDRIWSEVALMQMREIETQEKINNLFLDERVHIFTLRGGLSMTMNRSTTESTQTDSTTRGFNFELLYGNRFFNHYEFAAGIRYDTEDTAIENPSLVIETTRQYIIGEAIYHFNPVLNSKSHWYVGIGGGIGSSATDVSGDVKTGVSKILPSVRVGYETLMSKGSSWIVEGVFESISSSESFEDGDEQTTNMLNSKINLGIRF